MTRSGRRIPVIIGVGDVVNRSKNVKDAVEPLQLMINAIQYAIQDTGLSASHLAALQSEIDSVDVVKTWTWPCDYPSLIAERLAFKPLHKDYSEHGGNQPARCVDDAARRISLGESKVAIVTGGEALASCGFSIIDEVDGVLADRMAVTACAAAKQMPPPGWTPASEDVNAVFSPTTRELQPSWFMSAN